MEFTKHSSIQIRRLIAAVWLSTSIFSTASQAIELNVYILTGQSNSLGHTRYEGSTVEEYGPGTDNADAQTRFFWANSAKVSQYPAELYGDSGGSITTLQMQQGGNENPAFWGPEFGFARTIAAAGQSNVMVIKASRDGGGNSCWDKATFDSNKNTGHMWGHLRDTTAAALTAAINAGYKVNVRGLMYQQGTGNTSSEAAVADVRLANLFSNLGQYINSNYANAAANMQLVVGEISTSWSTADHITTAGLHRELAESHADVSFIQTHDQPTCSDGLHFNRDAKLVIGQRYAHAFLDLQNRPAEAIARYTADLSSPAVVPHPTTQGWTEIGSVSHGTTSGVTLAGTTEGGTRGWEVVDASGSYTPGYSQSLTSDNFQDLYDAGWRFRVKVKVQSGGGLAFWSVTSANAPAGWSISDDPGNMCGFRVDRVNDDEFQVRLLKDSNAPIVNLGAGTADDFHTLELLGEAGSSAFTFLIDGEAYCTGAITNRGGLADYTDCAAFGSALSVAGDVLWNEVSLSTIPEPSTLILLIIGASVLAAWRRFL